jgi:hypothetical protein
MILNTKEHSLSPCSVHIFATLHLLANCNGMAFVHFLASSQTCEKRLLASSCLPVRLSAWNNSAPTGRIFMKFDI